MLPNFRWPEPEHETDAKLISDVKTYGWHVLRVFADQGGPDFAYSVGLFLNYGHPEVIIIGLDADVAHKIINTIGEGCAQGEAFHAGRRTDRLLKGYDACFVDVAFNHYSDYFGYAIWFYSSSDQPFPAVQMVWPDRGGRLPWEEGYDAAFSSVQPVLAHLQ